MSPSNYMKQLDGCRAIAVIAVIIFHLNPKWLPGGYLGVDVFFILSGFLITRILHRDFKQGTYSWGKFITRRIRRLMPALMTMIAVVTIAGSFLLVFPNRQQLLPQAWAAIFSYSNYFYYFTTGGYWGDDTSSIALLHTWSLAVEEQFYLIYPLLFYAIFKISPKSYKHIIAGLFILAIAGYLLVYSNNPDLAFYSLHTRAWQLLLGGSLALWTQEKPKLHLPPPVRHTMALGSLVTLCSCFYFLDHKLANESNGWAIMIPCLAATCLIWCASCNSSSLKILGTTPMTYIGKTSYSLYLWHWPVIVMAKFVSAEPSFSVLILIIIICAFTSYHLIEKPFRYGRTSILKISICWLALPCISIALMSQIKSNPLVPGALKPMMDEGSIQDRKLWRSGNRDVSPVWGYEPRQSDNAPLVVINGSSHARVLCGALNEYAQTYQYRFCSLSVAAGGVTQTSKKKVITDRKPTGYATRLFKNFSRIFCLWPDIGTQSC